MMTITEIKTVWAILHSARYRLVSMLIKETLREWIYAFKCVPVEALQRATHAWIDDREKILPLESRPWPHTWEIADYLESKHMRPPPPMGTDDEWRPPTGTPQILRLDPASNEMLDITEIRWAEFRRMWAGHQVHVRAGCRHVYPGLILGFKTMGINEYTAKLWPFPPGLDQTPIGATDPCGNWCMVSQGARVFKTGISQFDEVIKDSKNLKSRRY